MIYSEGDDPDTSISLTNSNYVVTEFDTYIMAHQDSPLSTRDSLCLTFPLLKAGEKNQILTVFVTFEQR